MKTILIVLVIFLASCQEEVVKPKTPGTLGKPGVFNPGPNARSVHK